MKKLVLFILSMLAFAGMSVAQDVYYSGKFTNEYGFTSAGVYKNGEMIYNWPGTMSSTSTSESVLVDGSDVYWVHNAYDNGNYVEADVYKNGNIYLDNPYGGHRHIWAIAKNDHLWSVGTMDDHEHAKCWRDDDPTPYWNLDEDGAIWGNSFAVDVDLAANGDVYIGGYHFMPSGGNAVPRGFVWKNGEYEMELPNNTAILDLAVYEGVIYSVCWYKPEDNSNYYIAVYKNNILINALSFTDSTINGADYRNWKIKIDAGDVYVSGYYASTPTAPRLATVWKNGEVLYQQSSSTGGYFALDANSSGIYYAGEGDSGFGAVWKDNTLIHQHTAGVCSQVWGLYVDNSCQDNETLTLPFFDGFENGETSWPCWTTIDVDHYNTYYQASYWDRSGMNETNNVTPYTGDYCARHSLGQYSQEGWLISPRLFLQPHQDGTAMHFLSKELFSYDNFGYEGVWVSTTGTSPSDFTEVWSAGDDPDYEPSASWKYVTVYLNEYQGEAIYIAFKYSGTNRHNWYIDDVSVGESWEPYLGAFNTPYLETFQYPETHEEPGYYWYVLDNDHSGDMKCWKHNASQNCVYHPYGNNDGSYQDGWLFSPSINLEAGKSYVMNYTSMVQYWENDARSTIWYALDEDGIPDPSNYMLWDEPFLNYEYWETFEDNISQLAGHSVRFAFRYEGTYAHNWYIKNFSIEEGIAQYTINVTANNNAWGSVTGGGHFDPGSSCTISASANSGYEFKKWTKNGSDVSTSPVYTFTVNENATYTAIFGEPAVTYYTISTEVNPAGAGTVDGGGTYPAGETVYLSANANTGYVFDHWNDGSATNPRAITVNGNATYTAYFIQQTYTLTVNADPAEGGTVTGGGSNYHYGDVATLTATANEGYTFASWSDGNTNSTRSVTVTGDATYTAYFNASGSTTYTVTVLSENPLLGSVSGSGSYPEGAIIQISASPAHHARFVGWDDGNTDNPRTITVTGNLTFTAKFEVLQSYTITVESADPTMGSVTGGGTFTEGSTITISANANEGYYFSSWDDGNADNPRTITVTGNATYKAIFSSNPVTTYTLTVICNTAQGSVIGSGTYTAGTTVTIAAIPHSGYEFEKWNDENTDNPRLVTVNENMTFVAFFKGTGVGENEGSRLVLYPNPASNYIRIEGIEANAEVRIYNAMGALVKVVNTNADEEIGISDLSAGLYFVRCGNITMRFLKE